MLRYLFYLAALAAAALAIYAVFADLPAPVQEITVDVPLPANG
ncbi:MAG TPA: hypothetical protein VFR34_02345 [Paracoccaceae bacterium]|nr:hypothetical protein [Paracoccaceae bacterium]